MGKSKIFLRPTPMLRKQIGQMRKLFGLWDNSKCKDPMPRVLNQPKDQMTEGVPQFLSQTRNVRTSFVTRRQIVLNRHFTEIISDVLATSHKTDLDNLGVSITSIETRAWNKGVCIFYTTNGPYDDDIRTKLNKLVPTIRFSISERRLIGRTPQLAFVYDNSTLFDKVLSQAISEVRSDNSEEESRLTVSRSQHMEISHDLGVDEVKLISKRFMAPADMDNSLFGLNYACIYDEAVHRLIRGREEVSRLRPTSSALAEAKPLFHVPKNNLEEEDPVKRVLSIKKFLVSQQRKSDNSARYRRKMELMSRNANKWEVEDGDPDPEFVNLEG